MNTKNLVAAFLLLSVIALPLALVFFTPPLSWAVKIGAAVWLCAVVAGCIYLDRQRPRQS